MIQQNNTIEHFQTLERDCTKCFETNKKPEPKSVSKV